MKGERVPAKINPAPSQRQIGAAAAMSVIPSKAGMVLHCSELALRATSSLPRCKNGRRKLGPRRDATRSHATLAAIRWPHSGLEA